MRKLKTILQSNLFYIILILFTLTYSIIILKMNIYRSNYSLKSKYCYGTIINIKEKKYATVLDVRVGFKERIIVYDYTKNKYNIGDKIKAYGSFNEFSENTNFFLFNYKNYMKSYNSKYQLKANKIIKYNNSNFIYKIKNLVLKRINKINNPYLYTFIMADNSQINKNVKTSYQSNGISHLFALSGTHIALFTSLLFQLLKRIKYKFGFISIVLLFYLFFANFSKSLTRAVLLYIGIEINKLLNINISNTKIIILILCFSLIYNPYNVYNTSFLYSYVITISLVLNKDFIKRIRNYFFKVIIISTICYIAAIPISINTNFQLNFLSVFLNLIFVPFISFIIFPMSLLVFVVPIVEPLYNIFTIILETISLELSKIHFFYVTFCHTNFFIILLYYIIIFLLFKSKNIIYIAILFAFLFTHANYKYLNNNYYYVTFDVGQGDSSLIIFPNNKGNILIDTSSNKLNSEIIPALKSRGLNSIDYLILSHGDYDHMGEAINLVETFKVEKVIFNCGEFNELEQELIKVLNKKKIPYYSCIKELNIDDNKLYFLQTKEYDNENDNSNVIYTEINGYKFMFMGDAGVEKEKDILEKYNISNIDVLKVGHHGSKTSSGKEFIDEINPKYSIISVGKNNRYRHPNKEVLNTLEDSKIYRTDQDGSIMFRIKNDKLQIETCSP